jgi:hypothetical protein
MKNETAEFLLGAWVNRLPWDWVVAKAEAASLEKRTFKNASLTGTAALLSEQKARSQLAG